MFSIKIIMENEFHLWKLGCDVLRELIQYLSLKDIIHLSYLNKSCLYVFQTLDYRNYLFEINVNLNQYYYNRLSESWICKKIRHLKTPIEIDLIFFRNLEYLYINLCSHEKYYANNPNGFRKKLKVVVTREKIITHFLKFESIPPRDSDDEKEDIIVNETKYITKTYEFDNYNSIVDKFYFYD